MTSPLHDPTSLKVTVCTCHEHDFGSGGEALYSPFSVNASLKAVFSFNDFDANEWQAFVGGCLHREFSAGGVGFIRVASKAVAWEWSRFFQWNT